MKPFILPIPAVDRDGKIRITPEDLDKLIEKAYDAGYVDGKAAVTLRPDIMPVYPSSPSTPVPGMSFSPTCPTVWYCNSTSTDETLKDSKLTNYCDSFSNWTEEIKKAI